MSEISLNQNNIPNFTSLKNNDASTKPDLNIKSHYSDNMKIQRPKIPAFAPGNLPNQHYIQSVTKEADTVVKQINNDIYTGVRKENNKHGFNKVLYFKIFGGITLATIIVTCLRKFKK